jgi:hypothetical protein
VSGTFTAATAVIELGAGAYNRRHECWIGEVRACDGQGPVTMQKLGARRSSSIRAHAASIARAGSPSRSAGTHGLGAVWPKQAFLDDSDDGASYSVVDVALWFPSSRSSNKLSSVVLCAWG